MQSSTQSIPATPIALTSFAPTAEPLEPAKSFKEQTPRTAKNGRKKICTESEFISSEAVAKMKKNVDNKATVKHAKIVKKKA